MKQAADVNMALCKVLGVENPNSVLAVDVSVRPDSFPEIRVRRFLQDLTTDTQVFDLSPRAESIDVTSLSDEKPRKVTESPWHVMFDPEVDRVSIQDTHGMTVATVPNVVKTALVSPDHSHERLRWAYLIAAAPILATLLEEIVASDDVYIYPAFIDANSRTAVDFEDWAHRVRQALRWVSEARV